MKYLHVISSLDPQGGGPAEGVRQLSVAARRLGVHMEIASLDMSGEPWEARYACPVHAVGAGRLGKYRYEPRLDVWLAAHHQRFDAVIVNGLWQYHGLAAWRTLRKTSTPYFVFTHGMLDPWFKRRYPVKHLKKWLYWPWAEYRVLRDARAVLFTCEEERLQARQSFSLYRARELVVSYGTPGPEGDAAAQRELFLTRFPVLRGKRVLLFLGRIHPKKGCDLLVEAFARTASRDASLQLVMAGPDHAGMQATLMERSRRLGVDGRIVWTGMLDGDLKWGAFRAAEAFVLPSHQENFGIAVAEALACGVPVLISDKVNIWREIQADGAAIAADDSLNGATVLLERWLSLKPAERERMSHSALRCFGLRYHIDAAAKNIFHTIETQRCERQLTAE